MSDALGRLAGHGVSVWLDGLSRELIESGQLAGLIRDRHVRGVMTNPAVLASALAEDGRYRDRLHALAASGTDAAAAVALIIADDVRAACDLLHPTYSATKAREGMVSVEVDPRLAAHTEALVAAAKTLSAAVDRPNLLIRIPATTEGLAAVSALVAEGIGVDVGPIFGVDRYREVLEAFFVGLEVARAAGEDMTGIASVASFPLSPIDTEVDSRLASLGSPEALALRGRAGLANAWLAYQVFEQTRRAMRWFLLEADGARLQRPLWHATAGNPGYPDTHYPTQLDAPAMVTAMPPATLSAVADHGDVSDEVTADRLTTRYQDAAAVLESLQAQGISPADVAAGLEADDLARLQACWDDLLAAASIALSGTGSSG